MATNAPELVELNDGVRIPQLGFGVFQIAPDEVVEPVRTALEAGYRLIDTAAGYGNEEGVGRAIRESGVSREEIFVTTKLRNGDQGYDNALRAFEESMRLLGLDVLDLWLIHWPVPSRDLYVETWRAFEKLHRDGRIRSIGVSNFTPAHLERLMAETEVVPVLNQVELHPGFPQQELRAFHDKHHIATEAWAPIGQGKGLLERPEVAGIAERHGKSAAQVVLRWHLQLGNVVIPKSSHPQRIRENFDVFGFSLTQQEIDELSGLAEPGRIGPDPDEFAMA